MSTRCQIGIYPTNDAKITEYEILLYRHSDGYPDGVIPDIEPFIKNFKKRRGFSDGSDVEYLAAWLVHHLIEKHIKEMIDINQELKSDHIPDNGKDYLGHGICGDKQIHGDIAFFYAVHPDRIDVYQVGYVDAMESWNKLSSVPLEG